MRIDAYKRISAIETEDDEKDVLDELIDRFGEPPKPVRNLIEIASIKALAKEVGITEISQKGNCVLLTFLEDMLSESVIELIMDRYYDTCTINPKKPVITYREKQPAKMMGNIKFLLQKLNELHKEDK